MKNRKFYTCCFTGHRPSNLPWKYEEKGFRFLLFKIKLKIIIKNFIKAGYKYFISGMALGSDMIFAETIIKLKKKYSEIELECAIPCKNQTEKWFYKYKKRYYNILTQADKITFVSNSKYYNGCMQKRNRYMIEKSNMLIAVYTGGFGGTKQTIKLAEMNNLKIQIIKP